MTLHACDLIHIPEETVRVARAAFPKGNVYMTMRDRLNLWYKDSDYADLFTSHEGRPAESPGRLNLVMVMQYAEGLTDQQAAAAVRGRIDWKYALGLPLTDPGFDASVLSNHRQRLLDHKAEEQLLDDMLAQLQAAQLLKARGRQRTDATHVLSAARVLNRLERLGETMRQALNALAKAEPHWLLGQITPDWFDLYGPRFEQYRLPDSQAERQALMSQIGQDGAQLLAALEAESAPPGLSDLPAVQLLQQVWQQQFKEDEAGELVLRDEEEGPPLAETIQTPYDVQARYNRKRQRAWVGYTAHFTETCDQERPHLVVNVETTPASTHEGQMTEPIHAHLSQKERLPSEHLVDAIYVDAQTLVSSQADYQVELVGPVTPDTSWQAKAGQGFDAASFDIDWQAQQVTCPAGQTSVGWHPGQDAFDNPIITVTFSKPVCQACADRAACTRLKDNPRNLRLKPKEQYLALQAARQRQTSAEFKDRYRKRAGIEGTLSQAVRSFHLRRSRYVGLAKTHLQHLLIAAAINLTRAVDWLQGQPRAQTRITPFMALAKLA